jgi:hypothetical protein
MLYRILGMLVWNGGKALLKQKYGRTYMPKPVFAGILLALVGGVVLLVTRHNGSDA